MVKRTQQAQPLPSAEPDTQQQPEGTGLKQAARQNNKRQRGQAGNANSQNTVTQDQQQQPELLGLEQAARQTKRQRSQAGKALSQNKVTQKQQEQPAVLPLASLEPDTEQQPDSASLKQATRQTKRQRKQAGKAEPAPQQPAEPLVLRPKQKVLVLASRGITFRCDCCHLWTVRRLSHEKVGRP